MDHLLHFVGQTLEYALDRRFYKHGKVIQLETLVVEDDLEAYKAPKSPV